MQRLNAIRTQCLFWKMPQILRNDDIAASSNRSSQNMPITTIRKLKRFNQPFIADNQRITGSFVHLAACSLQSLPLPLRLVPQERFDPFLMN